MKPFCLSVFTSEACILHVQSVSIVKSSYCAACHSTVPSWTYVSFIGSLLIFTAPITAFCVWKFSRPKYNAPVARKRSRSFCQKCRWQVTAKHSYTLCMWLCMKWHGAWLYGVHRTRRDGSSFLWHQPCQRCTPLQWIFKKRAVNS